jgi:4'-phosphopantetheinyl transferase
VTIADVAVWRVPLDPASAPDAGALAELSPAERARAALFATDALRNRWLGAHVALRRILARALDVAPASIVYGKADAGKPFIASPAGRGLEFNFSDSGDLALVAVSRCGPIGVDVEFCRPDRDLVAMAESFFAAEEQAALRALPEEEQTAAFYRIWARKEAFIKAIGLGLQFGLGRFAVSSEAEAPRLLRVDADARADGAWRLEDVSAGAGYAGALAVPSHAGPITSVAWER